MTTVGETFILYLAKKERKAFESHIEIFAILERKAVNRRWRSEEVTECGHLVRLFIKMLLMRDVSARISRCFDSFLMRLSMNNG